MAQDEEKSKHEKTEDPTEEKRSQAREEGSIASPREIMGALTLIIITLYFYFYSQNFILAFKKSFENTWSGLSGHMVGEKDLWHIIFMTAKPILPFFLFLFASLAIFPPLLGLTFTRFNWSWKKMELNFNKLNIVTGLSRIFGMNSIGEFGKVFAKFCLLVVISYFVLRSEIVSSGRDYFYHYKIFTAELGKSIFHLLISMSLIAIVIGIFDYTLNYWKLFRDLKMTKQEVKEEHKRHEGDPLVKSQRKRFARDLIFRKSLREVPKASFIVTNPEHYSIAIRYVKGMRAPIILAKGVDAFAFRIREVAKKHDIMIVENKPLARALYAQVKVGTEVPPQFYNPIIEIMKYIYRLKGKQYFEKIT